MSEKPLAVEVYLEEYGKLKDEQNSRIGFRDNLLYVTLGLFGGILSFALPKADNYYALLVLPWVCLILGWTYLVNDEKISALGRYLRLELTERIKKHVSAPDTDQLFGWEVAHRSDTRRERRKIEQLIIDEITFVFSGVAAIVAFWLLAPQAHVGLQLIGIAELILLLILGVEIIIYADLAKGR